MKSNNINSHECKVYGDYGLFLQTGNNLNTQCSNINFGESQADMFISSQNKENGNTLKSILRKCQGMLVNKGIINETKKRLANFVQDQT